MNQHYVWRYYLEAWQREDGLVCCSRSGKLLPPTRPKRLMVERDYYKLSCITKADVTFLRPFIESAGSVALIQSHRNLVTAFVRIAAANELIQRSDRLPDADKRRAQAVVVDTEEKLHQRVEGDAKPFLEQLRQRHTDFIATYETSMAFSHFIAQQYFRSKRIREAIGKQLAKQDRSHLKHIVCHIAAVNVGGSLFVDRAGFDIILLENSDNAGFITSDQPIVNLLGTRDSRETRDLAFYYPLSPSLSCVIVPKDFGLQSSNIPVGIVEDLNRLMAWEAADFLVANTDEVLQYILNKPSLARPSGWRILESIAKRQVQSGSTLANNADALADQLQSKCT